MYNLQLFRQDILSTVKDHVRLQVAPSPMNLLTTWIVLLRNWCVQGKLEKEVARRKFRTAMKEDLLPKAPGMKFSIGLKDRPPPPRVIHALGNY